MADGSDQRGSQSRSGANGGRVSFCGEEFPLTPGRAFTIGRDADLVVDENPYLHRRFLAIEREGDLWWVSNVGSQLTATVADAQGTVQAWLAPRARLPLVFDHTLVWFSAGPTTYEIEILIDRPAFAPVTTDQIGDGTQTIGPQALTPDQRLILVALCEPTLRDPSRGRNNVPTSADAADRLGWTLTRFNRKLDNVCEKLTRGGVHGLHGGPDRLAMSRRSRLVEFALATQMVSVADLALLDAGPQPGERE